MFRPDGFKFDLGGLNTISLPDMMPANKYQSLQNVRATGEGSMQTRPGYIAEFTTAAAATVTDVRGYATLGTDDLPRLLVRDNANHIILDTGTTIVTLAGTVGKGVVLLPFRPGASSQSWMYIASLGDYQKLSAPDAGNNVTAAKVGIAEPQLQMETGPNTLGWTEFDALAASWTAAGTAGAPGNNQIYNDAINTAIYADPVISGRYTITVTYASFCLQGVVLKFSGGQKAIVQDVLPSIGTGLTIQAIRYDAGVTGLCTIVPTAVGGLSSKQVASIRRGALVHFAGGGPAETDLIYSSTVGTNGSISFRTSTTGTLLVGQTIAGLDAVVVDGVTGAIAGNTIVVGSTIGGSLAAGTGTYSQNLGSSPFGAPFAAPAGSPVPRENDYISFFLQVGDPTLISNISIIFSVGNTVDYVNKTFSFSLSGASLTNGSYGSLSVIRFPISALTDNSFGGSLSSCNGVQVSVTTSNTVAVFLGSLSVTGGGNPDVGTTGIPYQYRIRGRSSVSGAVGNSSPVQRYGIQAHRQNISVLLPSVASTLPAADSQVDIWDVFRYGGSVTSYRYIGSGSPSTTFTDTATDAAAQAGTLLEIDNYEPWTSVGVPWTLNSGGGVTIVVTGTELVVAGNATWPAEIARWLPGTLILLNGLAAVTLRARPVVISGTSYLFHLEESLGTLSPAFITVQEPLVGRQPNPWMVGPNAQGDFFAFGDALRPGVVSWTKHYAPDSAPPTNNLELCPPSEPLIAGSMIDGLTYVASSARWWALYPGFNTTAYQQIERPVGKIPVSPYGVCSDGTRIYFWAKDGICSTDGGTAQDLTRDDLYNLFPHEGVQGANVTRNGILYYAPSYSRVAEFRLSVGNGFLYADYPDSVGNRHTLVYDMSKKAWISDVYHDIMWTHYSVEQEEGTLTTAASLHALLIMAGASGKVWRQKDLVNDDATPIPCIVATFEYDGGDTRTQPLWGDEYIDLVAPAGASVRPLSGTGPLAAPTVVGAGAGRQFVPVSVLGQIALKSLGLQVNWTDDFSVQSAPTTLQRWQPSLIPQPEIIVDAFGPWNNSLGGGGR